MAVTAFTNAQVLISDLDASPFVNKVTSQVTLDMLDSTVCGTGGFRSFAPGFRNGEMSFEGFEDWAAAGFYAGINQADGGVSTLASVAPIAPGATLTAGDPVAFMRGPIVMLDEGSGAAGELAKMAINIVNDSVFIMGTSLHPLALRSTTASGTAVALTGPTAAQQMYAGLHVTAGSGGTLTVRVQSDDNGGFASPTTRITFTATTGPVTGGQMLALTPIANLSTETFWRADWTVSAGPGFTFAVVAGVNTIV